MSNHSEVAERLPSEINRRDALNAEMNAWWSTEVTRRYATADALRRKIDWLRSGGRRFIVRRRPPTAS